MTSPAKRQRLDSVLTESLEDLDTELKAICYDITINNGAQAIKSIEKVRRKLKATEGKLKTLNKIEIAENCKLIKENMELQKEINNLKKKIEELEDDSFLLSVDDQPLQDSSTISCTQESACSDPSEDVDLPGPSKK